MALARWDDEGGALAGGSLSVAGGGGEGGEGGAQDAEPALSNAELVQLRVRVIALENLLLVLLAQTSDEQLSIARERAAYISPRPGFTRHPLTLHAAAQMLHLVGHASQFRGVSRSQPGRYVPEADG